MPHLELRQTTDGPRYFLEDRPLVNDDAIEVRTALAADGWVSGEFHWNGDPSDEPWFQTTDFGFRLSGSDDVRWFVVNPSPPPPSPTIEPSDTLKDWEKRER